MTDSNSALPQGDRAGGRCPEPDKQSRPEALIPSASGILFSHRDKVFHACADPGSFVGPRLGANGIYEHMDHWRARAALEAVMQLVSESPAFAQAIEAQRAATTGAVYESAVGSADASEHTPKPGGSHDSHD